jgi:hypothetical protein
MPHGSPVGAWPGARHGWCRVQSPRHVAEVPRPELVRQRGLHQLRRAAGRLAVVVLARAVAAVATRRHRERARRAAYVAALGKPQALAAGARPAGPRRAHVRGCALAARQRVVARVGVAVVVPRRREAQAAVRARGVKKLRGRGRGGEQQHGRAHLAPPRAPPAAAPKAFAEQEFSPEV